MADLSVIIPVYNEAKNIPVLFERLNKTTAFLNVEAQYIFVNDGSTDNSLAIIKEFAEKYPFIKYIDFSRNFGHQVAISAGIDYASGKFIAILDADLQDPPELLSEMFSKIKSGYDVVYAKRKSRKDKSVLKKMLYLFFYRILARISSTPMPLDTGDFRIISKRVGDVLKGMEEKEKFLRGQVAWAGFKQTFVEYDREARHEGVSGYSYEKLFKLALEGITSFSNFPLRLATFAGIIVSGISFLLILYALYSHFFLGATTPKGWTSLMICILFIGGVQLICIGIIGEYISRLNANVRKRPLYIINEQNIDSDSSVI